MPKNKAGGRWRRATPPCLITVHHPKKLRDILGKKAKLVRSKTDWGKVPELVKAMRKILRKARGQAIAAPQVGFSLKVIVIETRKTKGRQKVKPSKLIVMVNPKIIGQSRKKVTIREGCLSLAHPEVKCVFRARVSRPTSVTVEFLDLTRRKKRRRFTGFSARVVQHEVSHLSGECFLQCVDWSGNAWEKVKFEPM